MGGRREVVRESKVSVASRAEYVHQALKEEYDIGRRQNKRNFEQEWETSAQCERV